MFRHCYIHLLLSALDDGALHSLVSIVSAKYRADLVPSKHTENCVGVRLVTWFSRVLVSSPLDAYPLMRMPRFFACKYLCSVSNASKYFRRPGNANVHLKRFLVPVLGFSCTELNILFVLLRATPPLRKLHGSPVREITMTMTNPDKLSFFRRGLDSRLRDKM
ncbi:hypothetical protein FB45DRAFT_260789 [Roridomyces roridus]|uniref:Uncharacterized protein n=1 Tax=Roridomyces roridus TaxID=1738132 RepID=A0AAD7B9K3_9AGAR|nr:hypothetical protein FB45DRAFT_260789 [Roridomyces roridus]